MVRHLADSPDPASALLASEEIPYLVLTKVFLFLDVLEFTGTSYLKGVGRTLMKPSLAFYQVLWHVPIPSKLTLAAP